MKRMKLGWMGFVVAMAGTSAPQAFAHGDGWLLLENCEYAMGAINLTSHSPTDMSEGIQSGACSGIVQGAKETIVLINHKLPKETQICVPESLSPNTAVKDVYEFLVANKQLLNEPQTALILLALKKKYPCA